MNRVDHKPQPESWDEATDFRRFWWLIFPFGIAAWAAGLLIFVDGGSTSLGFLNEPSRRTERTEQTLPALEGQFILLENIRGRVTIRTGLAGEIRLIVERSAEAASGDRAQRSLDAIQTNINATNDVVRIFMAGVSGEPRDADTEVTLYVPPGVRIDAATLAGDVLIEIESAASITAGTASGDIEVRIPRDASLSIGVRAQELRAEFALERSSELDGRVLFRNQVAGGYSVDLDLLAPNGRVTLRSR